MLGDVVFTLGYDYDIKADVMNACKTMRCLRRQKVYAKQTLQKSFMQQAGVLVATVPHSHQRDL